MKDVLEKIGKIGIVPVVVIDNSELAVPAAQSLINGGLKIMEITMRTEDGIKAIKKIKKALPDMLLGAGTVLSIKIAKEAVDAGVEFIVSPGLNLELVKWCQNRKITIIPGVLTPTEIQKALNLNLNVLKFFPGNIFGGINGCKALYGPFRMVKFIPTGGINKENLEEYVDKPYIHAVGGSWLCDSSDINNREFGKIVSVVKESIDILLGFELAHIGINIGNAEESSELINVFSGAFGFKIKEGHSSDFLGPGIEISRSKSFGTKGHIAIKTNNIDRAAYYLNERGYGINWSTIKGNKEKPIAVYLEKEVNGFAVHLLQK